MPSIVDFVKVVVLAPVSRAITASGAGTVPVVHLDPHGILLEVVGALTALLLRGERPDGRVGRTLLS